MTADHYLTFRSGDQWYAVAALSVRHVAAAPPLFQAPHCDPSLAGVCHLRNEFLAVVHLDVLLGAARPTTAATQLVAVASVHGAWALLVEEVRGMTPLDAAISPESYCNGQSTAVIGAASHEGMFVRLLDVNRLYKQVEERLRRGWAAADGPATAQQSGQEVEFAAPPLSL